MEKVKYIAKEIFAYILVGLFIGGLTWCAEEVLVYLITLWIDLHQFS